MEKKGEPLSLSLQYRCIFCWRCFVVLRQQQHSQNSRIRICLSLLSYFPFQKRNNINVCILHCTLILFVLSLAILAYAPRVRARKCVKDTITCIIYDATQPARHPLIYKYVYTTYIVYTRIAASTIAIVCARVCFCFYSMSAFLISLFTFHKMFIYPLRLVCCRLSFSLFMWPLVRMKFTDTHLTDKFKSKWQIKISIAYDSFSFILKIFIWISQFVVAFIGSANVNELRISYSISYWILIMEWFWLQKFYMEKPISNLNYYSPLNLCKVFQPIVAIYGNYSS